MRDAAPTYRFGEYTLDKVEHSLWRGDRDVFLRPKAFETLLYLVENHGHLVKKDELIEKVWSGVSVSDAVLTHCVAEVRQALEDVVRNPKFLKTVPRVGYKFIGEVEQAALDEEFSRPERTAPLPSAIVVLPFVNLSADAENEYFCDGLSEELINGLTKIKGLRVVAHSSAFTFKGRDTDAREIGRKLNVSSVLEGSVRKAGKRLRITAQLIDASDGYHLWSEQFDRNLDDIFAIQDEICLAILGKLDVASRPARQADSSSHPTGNLDAYHLYLKGRSFWHRRYQGFLQKAMECFSQAMEKDPSYAEAYIGLADCYNSLGIWAMAAPNDVFPRAEALVAKALDLNGSLADAHASQAVIHIFHDWDWGAAETKLRKAIELNPGNALTHLWYGHLLSMVDRFEEAFAEVNQAQLLDPLSPTINANVGYTYYLNRQHGRATDELKKTIELDPHFASAHLYLGLVSAASGNFQEAIEEFKLGLGMTGGTMPWAAGCLGCACALAGNRRHAEKVLSGFDRQNGYIPSSARILVYVGMGEDELVYEWLEKAFQERDAFMPWIGAEAVFDRYRKEPRFRNILWRMKLPH
jgi:TolB-like protein/Tfp pilus assembly protein PilF